MLQIKTSHHPAAQQVALAIILLKTQVPVFILGYIVIVSHVITLLHQVTVSCMLNVILCKGNTGHRVTNSVSESAAVTTAVAQARLQARLSKHSVKRIISTQSLSSKVDWNFSMQSIPKCSTCDPINYLVVEKLNSHPARLGAQIPRRRESLDLRRKPK